MEAVVDQTLVAALPDCGARGAAASARSAAAAGGGACVSEDDIAVALSAPTWMRKEAKALARESGGGVALLSAERRTLWRGVFLRREGGGVEAADAAASLYWETVNTCFGNSQGYSILFSNTLN